MMQHPALRGAIVRHFDVIGVIIGVSDRGYEIAEVFEPKRGSFGRHRADVAHDELLLPAGSIIRCTPREPIPTTATIAGRTSEITLARIDRALRLEVAARQFEDMNTMSEPRERCVRL